jgi:hypothetical protein
MGVQIDRQSGLGTGGSSGTTGTSGLLFAVIDTAASGDNTIVAADATRKIKVMSYVVVADAALAVRWKSGAATSLSGAMSLAPNGGVATAAAPPGSWLMETAPAQNLVLNLGGAVGARGHIAYFLEP